MASKPKAAPTPMPAPTAVSIDDEAKRRAELERRKRGGFNSQFRKRDTAQTGAVTGGAVQPLG
jgi:hypothetical protein